MKILFDEWMPDLAALTGGATVAVNVLPTLEGYESAIGLSPTTTPDVPADTISVQAYTNAAGSIVTMAYAPTKIYRLGDSGWNDVSVAGGYSVNTEYWSVVKWGDFLYASSYFNSLQKYDLSSASAIWTTVTAANVRARLSCIIRDFHVLFDTNDNTGSNPFPYRMHWSGRLRPEDFTPSLITQAGFRDLPDIGKLIRAIGGDYGTVLGSVGVDRIDSIGPPLTWQVSRLDDNLGCLFRNAVIKINEAIYWFSTRGWRISTGGPSVKIGAGKTDNFTKSHILASAANKISIVALSAKPVWMMSYVSPDSSDGVPDAVLFYNYDLGRFSEGKYKIKLLGTTGAISPTTDDLVFGELYIDDYSTNLDELNTVTPLLIAVSPTNQVLGANNTPDYLELTTRELQPIENFRARALFARLLGESDELTGSYTLRVQVRDKLGRQETRTGPWTIPGPSGAVPLTMHGRYHRYGFRGSGYYKSLLGIDIDFNRLGLH